MIANKVLSCIDCKQAFTFTIEEQTFYNEKGFAPPKRCEPCRKARKQKKRQMRDRFDAVCSGCGVTTKVPFEPDGQRPIYCRDCFLKNKPKVNVETIAADFFPPIEPASSVPQEPAPAEGSPVSETETENAVSEGQNPPESEQPEQASQDTLASSPGHDVAVDVDNTVPAVELAEEHSESDLPRE